MSNYYLSKGSNGVIISSNYSDAQRCLRYIHRGRVKKYPLFKAAEAAALEHLADILPINAVLPTSIPFNEMITIRDLIQGDNVRGGGE